MGKARPTVRKKLKENERKCREMRAGRVFGPAQEEPERSTKARSVVDRSHRTEKVKQCALQL